MIVWYSSEAKLGGDRGGHLPLALRLRGAKLNIKENKLKFN